MTELFPVRSVFTPDDVVGVEVRELAEPGALTVWHLGDPVASYDVAADGVVELGRLAAGGYGVELAGARTAVDVHADPRSRLRYGFVADHTPDRDLAPVLDNVRRLHLTAIQLYDWAYRHADLVGGGETYADALGQPVSLDTVRRLVRALAAVGSDALGYAAVYAVGNDEWAGWCHAALLQPTGAPYGLGDFLSLVDPAHEDWQLHFAADLAKAVDTVGLHGFHLDQYGYPRVAVRADGQIVDLADSFDAVIRTARSAAPSSRLVFNNVNDFPTWRTGSSPQDAVYVEVWEPHDTLGSLATLVDRARSAAAGKPVVVAAYQHVYDDVPASAADLATSYTMATLFSHGATQLLAGEGDRILVDPYYVRNHVVEPSTAELLRRWYDFLVEHDELLMAPGIVEVTGSWVGGYNGALDVTYETASCTEQATAGAVWRRVTEVDGRLVVHLVNLVGQADTRWDAPRATPGGVGSGTLRVRRVGDHLPRVRVADPDRTARLLDVPVEADGDHAVVRLPEPHVWQLVLIDLTPEAS